MKSISLLLFLNLLIGCSDDTVSKIDGSYTESIFFNDNFEEVFENIQSINVYKIPESKTKGFISDVNKLDKYGEHINIEYTDIRVYMQSVRNNIDSMPKCYENRDKETYHILVHKKIENKIGYFLLNTCRVGDVNSSIVRFLGSEGETILVYSSKAYELFVKLKF